MMLYGSVHGFTPGGPRPPKQPKPAHLNPSSRLPSLETLKLTGALKPLDVTPATNPVYVLPALGCAASALTASSRLSAAASTAISVRCVGLRLMMISFSSCRDPRSAHPPTGTVWLDGSYWPRSSERAVTLRRR